jgi:CBS domain-containing protein
MTPECIHCEVDDIVVSVARIMAVNDIGVVPVAKENKLVGMISDRDIVVRALAVHDDLSSLTAGEVMTDAVYYCYDDQHCADVARYMAQMQVRRMPVVTRDEDLVGLVSLGDIASHVDTGAAKDVFQGVSSGDDPLTASSMSAGQIPVSAGRVPVSGSKRR